MENVTISSISTDCEHGSATIMIRGNIPVPKDVSDPLVEIFRPLKVPHMEEILFTIFARHEADSIKLTIYPSNNNNNKKWCDEAIAALEGSSENAGLINEFSDLLEKYFNDPDGLELYLKNIQAIEANLEERDTLSKKCDEDTKKFVAKQGLKMPSLKRRSKSPAASKAEKRAKSAAYKASHPEKFGTTNQPPKKPAN